MKVFMINGSPHAKDNTYTAPHEMEKYSLKTAWKRRSCTLTVRQ